MTRDPLRRVDPTSEEDSYDDVVCVLQLLSHLVTKDLVDESDESASDKPFSARTEVVMLVSVAQLHRLLARFRPATHREVKVTDVVFFGIKKVMPLMTEGLLQFPLLAGRYFSLVS
ncbi:unnamed protein product, partial [Hapterophycus canaliculatus]